jgi:hypothetical protein
MDFNSIEEINEEITATELKITSIKDPTGVGKELKEALDRELKWLKAHRLTFNNNTNIDKIVEQVAKRFKTENDDRLKKIEEKVSDKKKFARTGCQQQYEHASKVLDVMQETLSHIENNNQPDVKFVQDKLQEGIVLLEERMKHILIAEEKGWDTVEMYKQKDYANDEDDQKAIDKAEKRAIAERGNTKSTPYHKGGKGRGKGGQQYHKQFNGNCNKCGKYGHRAHECRSRSHDNNFYPYPPPMHPPYPPQPGFPPHPGGKGGH